MERFCVTNAKTGENKYFRSLKRAEEFGAKNAPVAIRYQTKEGKYGWWQNQGEVYYPQGSEQYWNELLTTVNKTAMDTGSLPW